MTHEVELIKLAAVRDIHTTAPNSSQAASEITAHPARQQRTDSDATRAVCVGLLEYAVGEAGHATNSHDCQKGQDVLLEGYHDGKDGRAKFKFPQNCRPG